MCGGWAEGVCRLRGCVCGVDMEARIKGAPIHPLLRECVCYLRAGKTTVSAKFIADILYGSTAANRGGKAKEHKVSNHTFDRRMIELKQIEHITSKYGHQQNRENGQERKKERERLLQLPAFIT